MFSLRTAFILATLLVTGGIALAQERELPTVPRPRTLALEPDTLDGFAVLSGTLSLPENRDQPDGRKISLHIVVVPALTTGVKAPPLFDLAGGPGLAATGSAAWYAADSTGYRATRDIVLVDQRGTGRSNPLRCPELESRARFQAMYSRGAVERCRDELAKTADLTQYTTLAAARDMEAVRVALAYEKIDLIALSYGTMLAQTYMREYPQNVRCAVLMGTVPVGEKLPLHHARGADDVVQKLIDDCERDPSCGAKYSSIRNDWDTLLDSFAQGSVSTVYSDSLDRRLVKLDRGPFFEAFRTLLLTTSTQRQIPRIVHHAARGDFAPFFALAPPDSTISSPYAEGMYLCVTCPEGTQRISNEEIESETARTFLGRYRVENQMEACAVWPTTALSDDALAPVTANIPTLLLAGSMDYVAPVSWAQEVSSRLTDSRVVVIDNMGHIADGLTNAGCLDAMIRAFLSAGTTAGLDASCVETMAPAPFSVD